MHCMSVSLGLDGAGLGTVWGRQLATSMLADAGFGDVQVREVESDPLNYYYVRSEMTGHGRSIGASAAWRARSSSSQSPLQ